MSTIAFTAGSRRRDPPFEVLASINALVPIASAIPLTSPRYAMEFLSYEASIVLH